MVVCKKTFQSQYFLIIKCWRIIVMLMDFAQNQKILTEGMCDNNMVCSHYELNKKRYPWLITHASQLSLDHSVLDTRGWPVHEPELFVAFNKWKLKEKEISAYNKVLCVPLILELNWLMLLATFLAGINPGCPRWEMKILELKVLTYFVYFCKSCLKWKKNGTKKVGVVCPWHPIEFTNALYSITRPD